MKILLLGDSYTIGEGVPYLHNFPHQIASMLLQKNYVVNELTIVATTGWSTDELIAPMEMQVKKNDYDFVTILIGVNNQYRGRSATEFAIHFAYILNRAIYYAQCNAQRVIVLSIPDWGVTPFNTERDKVQISLDIDAYNNAKLEQCAKAGAHYVNVTESTRANASNADFLALDGLHPSQKEYKIWAEKCVEIIEGNI